MIKLLGNYQEVSMAILREQEINIIKYIFSSIILQTFSKIYI